jgi:PST family polysaccharide transporter
MINKLKNLSYTKEKKVLLSNFFSLSILQAFTYILPLLTLPYLVRVIGIELFGVVAFAQSIIMFLNMVVDYGFNLSATKEVSIHRENKKKLTEIFSSVMTIKVILIFISLFILSILIFSIEKLRIHWELYYLTSLVIVGQALFPIWYFQGIEKMKYITIVNVSSKLFFTILIFIFIQKESDYIYIPLLNALGFILAGVISLYIIFVKLNQNFDFSSLKIKEYLKNGFHIFLSIISSNTLAVSPTIFIGIFLDYSLVGYYSAFEKIVTAMKNFFYIINQTFFPRLSKVFTEDIKRYKNMWKKLSISTIVFSIIIYVILLFVSKSFIEFYFGSNFVYYTNVFNILAFTVVLYTIINALGLNGLLVAGRNKELSISQIIPTLIYLTLTPIILEIYGLYVFLFFLLFIDLSIIMIRLYFIKGTVIGKS